ncbi:hypothetical protein [Methanoregula formicica]|uniref:Uncharacterized protein n=1 Tax=Methanoregula formicica (strain DSM 22288 / NBRC 105244 / SMSP) TaxID=593750 RepID=L0HCX6_METFS|nr:hypothetical protein [Methanoregula formicica]AGB01641.1 hypothetical protein Metfor_0578 [Methanoregula formicica SMSP]
MLKHSAWAAVPGKTPVEKFGSLGLIPGTKVDIRKCAIIADNYGTEIWLFFEEDLARKKPLTEVLTEFAGVPEFERPVIRVESFLRFTRENDPSFEQTMEEFPLMVEVVATGVRPGDTAIGPEMYATCLMPFLDELDLEAEPPAPGVQKLPRKS